MDINGKHILQNTITSRVRTLSGRYLDIVKKYDASLLASERSKISEDVLELLNVEKPKIMFTGLYNAGKSTLVNALLGRAEAAMADKPETYEISEYDNGDYIIIDTPGVDAPIEHENITHDHIRHSHVVFFVISTQGTFEDRKNCLEMLNIIKKGKQLQIVLNNKSGENKGDDDASVIEIKTKIINNLVKHSDVGNIADKYDVLLVNAKSALRGRIENKQKLLEASNLSHIESTIKRIFKKEDAYKLLSVPCFNLKNTISYFSDYLTNKNTAVNKYERELTELERKRDLIITNIENLAKRTILNYEEPLVEQVLSNTLDIESVMKKINDTINNYLKEAQIEVERYLNIAFAQLLAAKQIEIDDADGTSLERAIALGDFKSNNDIYFERPELSTSYDDGDDETKSALTTFLKLAAPAALSLVSVPVALITAGVELLTSLLLSSGNKKQANEARRQAQMENERAMHMANEKLRLRQEARTKVRIALTEISDTYARNARMSINAYFADMTDTVQRLVSKNQEEYNYTAGIQKDLDSLRYEIENIIDGL